MIIFKLAGNSSCIIIASCLKLVYDPLGPDLTAIKVICAQVRAERDTYSIEYTDLIFIEGATLKRTRYFVIRRIMYGKIFHEDLNRSKIFTDRNRLFFQVKLPLSSDSRTRNSIGIKSRG